MLTHSNRATKTQLGFQTVDPDGCKGLKEKEGESKTSSSQQLELSWKMGHKLLEGESAEGLTGCKNANREDKSEEQENKEELLTESMKTHLQSKRQEAKMAVISEPWQSLPAPSETTQRNVSWRRAWTSETKQQKQSSQLGNDAETTED